MFTESPFAADDHLDVDRLSEDHRRDDRPVIGSDLVAVQPTTQEAGYHDNGSYDAEDERWDDETVGDIVERRIIADERHVGPEFNCMYVLNGEDNGQDSGVRTGTSEAKRYPVKDII